jgi:hypothetical protein
VTLDQLTRASLVLFAYQEGMQSGSLNVMKAILYTLRNRVRQGWHDGNWIEVMDCAGEVSGNEAAAKVPIDVYSRTFQMLMQSVDEIYFSNAINSDDVATLTGDALYYVFANQPIRPWFVDNIIGDAKNHPRIAQTGMLMLFR